METSPYHWPLIRGKCLVYSPHKGSVMQSFDVFFMVGLNNVLNKQSTADDLRCHDTHGAHVISLWLPQCEHSHPEGYGQLIPNYNKACQCIQWNDNFITLTKFLSLAALRKLSFWQLSKCSKWWKCSQNDDIIISVDHAYNSWDVLYTVSTGSVVDNLIKLGQTCMFLFHPTYHISNLVHGYWPFNVCLFLRCIRIIHSSQSFIPDKLVLTKVAGPANPIPKPHGILWNVVVILF